MKKSTLSKRVNHAEISQGTIITGKWQHGKYHVLRKIGSGMIGTVYLCREGNEFVALKISEQNLSMTTEVNVLKAINKVQDAHLGPCLLAVDDWEISEKEIYSFYVMEYIKGISLEQFVRDKGYEWIGIFLIQMLDELEALHQSGWVFGDLKNDNLLVELKPPQVRFIDVGGTTKIGRSIKEYSGFYDRAYWNLGSRKAEPSYDLFALVMIVLRIFHPREFRRVANAGDFICNRLTEIPSIKLYEVSLQKAIRGEFRTAKEMKDDIMRALVKRHEENNPQESRRRYHFIEPLLLLGLTSIYGALLYLFF